MKMTKIDDVALIAAGEHFVIIIGDKIYGKFHVDQLNFIMSLFKGRGQ